MIARLKSPASIASLHRIVGAAAAASATVVFVSALAVGIAQLS